jgi:protein-tyrosine phosphatase
MTTETTRALGLAGCANFRDLGGYETTDGKKTVWRKLFRSDSLHQITAEDVAALDAAGIDLAAGFDLRTNSEIELSGIGPLYDKGTRHLHNPFVPSVGNDQQQYESLESLDVLYMRMIAQASACVSAFFTELADETNYPLVFYCSAGKDRTGMSAALLLRVLGVSDEQIAADYHLTETLTLDKLQARLKLAGMNLPEHLLYAQPETILGFLKAIDETHGSVESYLESVGVSAETIEAVKAQLLEA